MELSIEYINKIEEAFQYNNVVSVKSAETMLIRIIRELIIEEEVHIPSENITIKSLSDFDRWVQTKLYKTYNSSKLLEIMREGY